jgi:aminopeptidase N
MEYPSLTMSGAGFGVTDHEIGHQWWPMMVGVNETWYGWMDEGFNQYMNILSGAAFRKAEPKLDGVGQSYGRMSGNEAEAPMMWNANYGGPLYSFTTYGKAPMMLSMLGGIVGDSAVQRAMSVYAKDWRFKHPSPWDYMFAMNRELHRDLGWFWYYWLFTTESVDGSISGVTTRAGKTVVTVKQSGQMPSPIVLQVEFATGGPAIRPMRNATVKGDTATVTWPVDVWFGGATSYAATLDFGARKIAKITLDPHGRFPDANPDDNVWPREPAKAAAH